MNSTRVDVVAAEQLRAAAAKYNFNSLIGSIPFLQFPADWAVRIIYPYGGATARFVVKLAADTSEHPRTVSVYLDCHSELGCMEEAYWEIYPNEHGDTERFIMDSEESEMIAVIHASLYNVQQPA